MKRYFEGAAERSSAASFWEGGNVNGRRRTVEIQERENQLREQGSIRALLELLEQQGMEQEKGDVLRMADYIDSMEMQLGTVLKELGEVKKQLGVMQESKGQTLCGEHNPEGGTSGANTSLSGGRIETKVYGTGRTGSF